ncbi:MAG: hypothetical protein ACC700_13690 [Anaerolineales bacterium]
MKSRCQAAGVVGTRKTTHSLWHSAIPNAIRNGAKPLQVQAMARHRSFNMTLDYYHEIGRASAPAENLIDYGRRQNGRQSLREAGEGLRRGLGEVAKVAEGGSWRRPSYGRAGL